MRPASPCHNHSDRPSVAACCACTRGVCDECFRFRIEGRAACARCAFDATTRVARRRSLAVSFLGFSLGGGAFVTRHYHLWDELALGLVFGAMLAVAISGLIAFAGIGPTPNVENRDEGEPIDYEEQKPTAGGGAYRTRARRVIMAAAPKISATATALVVLASFAASGVMLPSALHLPRWLEAELVLVSWWAIVALVLTFLLFRGFRLRDDFVYFSPWNRPRAVDSTGNKASSNPLDGCTSGCNPLDGCNGVDGEGVIIGIVVVAALAVAFGAAWIFVEFALPLFFFLMYALFMRAIARVANDRHECEGSLHRSIGWGLAWATAYIAPLAALAALSHWVGR